MQWITGSYMSIGLKNRLYLSEFGIEWDVVE